MESEKTEKKERALHVMPTGFTFEVRPVRGSSGTRYFWSVKKFGRVVAEGHEEKEPVAKRLAGIAIAEHASSKNNVDRNLLSTKLRQLLQKRPYLVVGACELILLGNANRGRLMEEAETYEQAWYEKQPAHMRVEIPSGGRTLSPSKAAEQLWNLLEGLSLIKVEDGEIVASQRLKSWVSQKFGPEVFK